MAYRGYKRIDLGVRVVAIVGLTVAAIYLHGSRWQIAFAAAFGLALTLMGGRAFARWRFSRDE